MKKAITFVLCIILILPLCTTAFAAKGGISYYIDAVDGNDKNDGRSPSRAWKSVAMAASRSFAPGDRILLKRGQTFAGNFAAHGNGSEKSPVVFSAYGKGTSPVIHAAQDEFLFIMQNVSHWVVKGIEFTSEGYGFFILAIDGKAVEDITVKNCYFHDICPQQTSTNRAAIHINNDRKGSVIKDIRLDSLRIENVAWGIHTNGTNAEDDEEVYISPERSYNKDFVFEDLYIKNAQCGGIVLSAICNGTVRNCRVLDCATAQDAAYAPLWIRHSDGITVEYCEIAGSANKTDGMAIDFDGWTVNCTYRYIYSHDNVRFMKNCVYDRNTKNSGNTVSNCVSVNDNQKMNWGAICLISTSKPSLGRMEDFSFSDSYIINGKPFFWLCTKKPQIKNIRFTGTSFGTFIQKLFNFFVSGESFTFDEPTDGELDRLIRHITAALPG